MIKIEFAPKVKEFFTSTEFLKTLSIIGFTILMTAVIASQNFFFPKHYRKRNKQTRYCCSKNSYG